MKKTAIAPAAITLAAALGLAAASPVAAQENLITPADVTDDTRIGMAILTNSVYSSNSIGTDIRNNINIITTPMTLQSCMGIAFAAAHSAHNATVSCHNNSGYSALVAVYDCKRQYRASDGSEGIFCRKTF